MSITLPKPALAASEPRLRTWLRRIITGGQIVETCPSYCTDHHRADGEGFLEDLSHGVYFAGVDIPVFNRQGPGTIDMPIFSARISVEPYSENPSDRVPHVNVAPWEDEAMEGLSPEQLADVIAKVREAADRLEGVRTALIAARAEAGVIETPAEVA